MTLTSRRRPSSENEARERLREAGLRMTRPRLLVYTALRDAGAHRTVDEIATLLARRGHDVPRMSIYNVVADLTAASVLMRADAGPGAALSEAGEIWHHHSVCRVCATIEDVPCVMGRKPCLDPPPSLGAAVDEAQVIFRGVCARCAKARRVASKS